MTNILVSFSIDQTNIRGKAIKLSTEIDKILKVHNYPEAISKLLAELISLTVLIGSTVKELSSLTLQARSENAPIKLIVADYSKDGHIRGYVDYDYELFSENNKNFESLADYFGDGKLIVTIDQGSQFATYQGIVELVGSSFSDALENYYLFSEQIDTKFKIAVGKIQTEQGYNWCSGGMMIQSLPTIENSMETENSWIEASILFSTIKDHELLDPTISSNDLLYRLYHDSGVWINHHAEIVHKCKCSNDKFKNIYESLSEENKREFQIEGKIIIKCEFCGNYQEF